MLPEEAVDVLRTVAALLASGAYEELETLTEGRRLTAPMMAEAVSAHGGLAAPPPEELAAVEPVELETGDDYERAFHVDVPLRTVRDGRPALLAQLTVAEAMPGVWTVELVGFREP